MEYPVICEAKTKEGMQRYFAQHLEDCAAQFGGTPESHRTIQLSNVGYFSGYYSNETTRRVNEWLGAVHPIFGAALAEDKVTPEAAFQAGIYAADKPA